MTSYPILPLRYCRTKIVCTLGPSSSSRDALRGLIEAGLNVARINFSHSTHEQHAATIATVRRAAEDLGRPIALLGDLQGPRIRIGDLPAVLELADGADVVLAPEEIAKAAELPVTYENLAEDVQVGDRVLIEEGLIEVVVRDTHKPPV